MRHLGRYDVLAVAARVLRCASEDVVRRSDLDAIDRVLDEARTADVPAEAAGVLLVGLVRARPFHGADRVVAVAVVLQLMALNHAELQLEPVEDVDDLLDRIANGTADAQQAAAFIRSRSEHRPVPADALREHFETELMIEEQVLSHGLEQEWWRGIQMYERFSEAARQIVVLGQEEARQLDHAYVGTEHLLLGVITYGSGIASRVLADLGVTAPAVRELVVEIVRRGTSPSPQTIPFTPRARSSFELAWNQARDRGADQVGPEHLLLGLLDDGHGGAGQIVTKLAESTDAVRRKLEQRMDRRRRSEAIVAETVTRLSSEESAEWSTYGRRHHLLAELNALLDENERLHEQVAALRNLLRRHDIDPDS